MYLVSEGIVGFMGHKTALVLQIASMKSVLTYFSNQICLTPLVLLSSFNFPSLQLEESTNHLFFVCSQTGVFNLTAFVTMVLLLD